MPQSLSKIYVHAVFSTKHEQNIIPESHREELQRYIIGCLSNIKSYTEEIYINPDHLHALCTLPRTVTTAQLISKMKTPSSQWLKENGISRFGWQDGYAAFSVSASNVGAVKKYILNQSEHHKKVEFKDELRLFLKNIKSILTKGMFGIRDDRFHITETGFQPLGFIVGHLHRASTLCC